jgi:hypothetical protein
VSPYSFCIVTTCSFYTIHYATDVSSKFYYRPITDHQFWIKTNKFLFFHHPHCFDYIWTLHIINHIHSLSAIHYKLVKISNATANILHCSAFLFNYFDSNIWPVEVMKINKPECFYRISFYSDALSQTASTYRYHTADKAQHLKPPLIHIPCLTNVWRTVRFLSRKWAYLHVVILLTYRCTILWSLR